MSRGNITIEIDTSGISETFDQIEDDIDNAVEEAASNIASEGLDAAKSRIRKFDRVWNKDVLNNWVPMRETTEFGVHMTGFRNYSDHASVVDEGATYTNKKPPMQPLRRYIISEYPHVVANGQNAVDYAAYQLQETIYENGITGIGYTNAAEQRMNEVAEHEVKKALRKQ